MGNCSLPMAVSKATSVSSAFKEDKHLLLGVVRLYESNLSTAKNLKAVMHRPRRCSQQTDSQVCQFLSQYSFCQPHVGVHICKLNHKDSETGGLLHVPHLPGLHIESSRPDQTGVQCETLSQRKIKYSKANQQSPVSLWKETHFYFRSEAVDPQRSSPCPQLLPCSQGMGRYCPPSWEEDGLGCGVAVV